MPEVSDFRVGRSRRLVQVNSLRSLRDQAGTCPSASTNAPRRTEDAGRSQTPHRPRESRLILAAPDRVQPAGPGAPGRRARRGSDRRVAGGDLGEGTRLAAATGAWVCFEDEAGKALRPPKARTWARRGHTPVVTVSGKAPGGISRGPGLPQARRTGSPVLPDVRPPRAQRRAPEHVRSRLRRPHRRRAPPVAGPLIIIWG